MQKVTALVERDITSSVATEVYAHELPILEVLHGPGKVTVHESVEIDAELDPDEEYARLVSKYGHDTNTGVTQVSKVYRNPHELEEAFADSGELVRPSRTKGKAKAKPAAE